MQLSRLRIIFFALILFGSFSNFAQNPWGNQLITVMELLIAITFFAEAVKVIIRRIKAKQVNLFNIILLASIILIFLYPFFGIDDPGPHYLILLILISVLFLTDGMIRYVRLKKKSDYLNGAFENFFLSFVFTGFCLRNLHLPGGGEHLLIGIMFLIPFYISKTISFIKTNYKKGKFIVGLLGLGSFATVILGTGLLFKILHWPFGYAIVMTGITLTFVLIIGSLKWNYEFDNRKINIFNALKLLKTQIVPVYFAVFTICFYGFLSSKGITPKFYSTMYPAAVSELQEQKRAEEAEKLAQSYENFVASARENGFIK